MNEKNSQVYDDSSITQLKGAERVRQRPTVMFGTDGVHGAFHTANEIVSNAFDEARAGFGKELRVTWFEDNSIGVRDFGRGVPMGWNEKEQQMNWHLVFNELYAGGKYNDELTGDSSYDFPLGLNGLGAASTQYTSAWFMVESYRDGKVTKKEFVKGYPLDEEVEVGDTDEPTGTYIKWLVDDTVFTSTKFTSEMFESYLEAQSHLNGVTIIFDNRMTGNVKEYVGRGLETFLGEIVGSNLVEVISKTVEKEGYENAKRFKAKASVHLAITKEMRSQQLHFHNTSKMVEGVHHTAYNDAVTDFFKSIGKENDLKIIPYDYENFLSTIVSSYSNVSILSFSNQTKTGVSNTFVYDIIYATVLEILEEAKAMQRPGIVELIDNVLNVANARKLAKEFEQQQRMVKKAVGTKKVTAEKFVDCVNKGKNAKLELYIVEGDSALGACKGARDKYTQALLPLRGKTINALKADLTKLLDNQIVKDIISTLMTGVDLGGEGTLFDIEKCPYDKIIFATDADIDGQQIRVLLYTIFYRLFPQLLEKGMVYVVETPLFTLTTSKGALFAYNVEERDSLLEECRAEGVHVSKVERSKGLGSNDEGMMKVSTMSKDSRRLVQLNIDVRDEMVQAVTRMLFGDDPNKERKGFIFSMLEEKLGEGFELGDLVDTVLAIEGEGEEEEVEEELETVG